METLPLPFSDPQKHQPEHLQEFYDQLHSNEHAIFQDPATGLYFTGRHELVASLFTADGSTGIAEISNKTTLDPLTPPQKFMRNWQTWPYLAHLARVPRATANAHGDNHHRIRAALIGEHGLPTGYDRFQEKFGAQVSTIIERGIDEFYTALDAQGSVDFTPYMQRISSSIIGSMIGFNTDRADIVSWSNAQANLLGRNLDRRGQIDGVAGLASLSKACIRLAKDVQQDPKAHTTPSLTAHMLKEGLTVQETAATTMNLIAAGYATSYGTTLNGLRRLLAGPRIYWDALDSPNAARAVTSEIMRLETDLIGWERHARKDAALGGTVIPRGSRILLLPGAANRDPRVFPDSPHHIQLDKNQPTHKQLTFGRGKHHCVGRGLALLEVQLTLQTLHQAISDLQIDPTHDITYAPDYKFRTPNALHLTK